jgi:hypothetical protein
MKVGELFVEFKIKGTEDSTRKTKEVRSALGSIKDMALETKAAIVGAILAFEKLMRAPMETGSSLYEVSKYTGETVENIQKMQAALKNVPPEKFLATYEEIFLKVAEFRQSIGPIAGGGPLGMFVMPTDEDYANATKFTDYLARVMQSPQMDPESRAVIAKQLGIDKNFLVALQDESLKGKSLLDFSPRTMLSGAQAKKLYQSQGQYNQVTEQVKKVMGSLTVALGPSILETVSAAVGALEKLVTALTELATTLKILDGLQNVMTGLAEGMDGIAKSASAVTKALGGKISPTEAIKEVYKQGFNIFKLTPGGLMLNNFEMLNKMLPGSKTKEQEERIKKSLEPEKHGQNTVNQNISIDGAGGNAEQIAEMIAQKTKAAFYQITSQTQIA